MMARDVPDGDLERELTSEEYQHATANKSAVKVSVRLAEDLQATERGAMTAIKQEEYKMQEMLSDGPEPAGSVDASIEVDTHARSLLDETRRLLELSRKSLGNFAKFHDGRTIPPPSAADYAVPPKSPPPLPVPTPQAASAAAEVISYRNKRAHSPFGGAGDSASATTMPAAPTRYGLHASQNVLSHTGVADNDDDVVYSETGAVTGPNDNEMAGTNDDELAGVKNVNNDGDATDTGDEGEMRPSPRSGNSAIGADTGTLAMANASASAKALRRLPVQPLSTSVLPPPPPQQRAASPAAHVHGVGFSLDRIGLQSRTAKGQSPACNTPTPVYDRRPAAGSDAARIRDAANYESFRQRTQLMASCGSGVPGSQTYRGRMHTGASKRRQVRGPLDGAGLDLSPAPIFLRERPCWVTGVSTATLQRRREQMEVLERSAQYVAAADAAATPTSLGQELHAAQVGGAIVGGGDTAVDAMLRGAQEWPSLAGTHGRAGQPTYVLEGAREVLAPNSDKYKHAMMKYAAWASVKPESGSPRVDKAAWNVSEQIRAGANAAVDAGAQAALAGLATLPPSASAGANGGARDQDDALVRHLLRKARARARNRRAHGLGDRSVELGPVSTSPSRTAAQPPSYWHNSTTSATTRGVLPHEYRTSWHSVSEVFNSQ